MSAAQRNEREVVEYKTGVLIPQHKMLKRLLDESGLGRNEWHDHALKKLGNDKRTLGSVNKLSDIFNGQRSRSLPMRDIVPYIQALGLNKKEEGHYISEFLKAHCDENLHQYIRSTSNIKDVGVNIRVQVLLEELSGLRNELAKVRHLEMPMQRKFLKPLEREVDAYKSQYKYCRQLLTKLSKHVFKNEVLGDDFSKEIFDYINDMGAPLETELSWERVALEVEEETEYLKYEESYIETSIMFELVNWFLILQLILQRQENNQFLTYISLFIPKNAFSSINDYIESELHYKRDDSLPKFRSTREVKMHLFNDFISEHPEEFEKELNQYVEHKDYDHRKFADAMIMPNSELFFELLLGDGELDANALGPPIILEPHKTLEASRFNRYVAKRMCVLKNLPLDLDFLKPKVKLYLPEEYKSYLKLKSLGVLERNSIAEIYQLSYESIKAEELKDTQVISSLIERITVTINGLSGSSDNSNPIKKYIEHDNYPFNFKEKQCFGDIDNLSPFAQILL